MSYRMDPSANPWHVVVLSGEGGRGREGGRGGRKVVEGSDREGEKDGEEGGGRGRRMGKRREYH